MKKIFVFFTIGTELIPIINVLVDGERVSNFAAPKVGDLPSPLIYFARRVAYRYCLYLCATDCLSMEEFESAMKMSFDSFAKLAMWSGREDLLLENGVVYLKTQIFDGESITEEFLSQSYEEHEA
jgi:hypothetical protein